MIDPALRVAPSFGLGSAWSSLVATGDHGGTGQKPSSWDPVWEAPLMSAKNTLVPQHHTLLYSAPILCARNFLSLTHNRTPATVAIRAAKGAPQRRLAPMDYLEQIAVDGIVDELSLSVPSGRGRKGQSVNVSVVRELNAADLEMLMNPPKQGMTTSPLVRLRNTHHQLARLLAEGKKPGECSLITGYSPSRVSILQNDPAFKELVAYYRENVEAQYLNVHERLAALGMSTIEELQERLEENPDGFKNKELMELATLLLDRSVAPPKGTSGVGAGNGAGGVLVNINFVGSQNAADEPRDAIIDVVPVQE